MDYNPLSPELRNVLNEKRQIVDDLVIIDQQDFFSFSPSPRAGEHMTTSPRRPSCRASAIPTPASRDFDPL